MQDAERKPAEHSAGEWRPVTDDSVKRLRSFIDTWPNSITINKQRKGGLLSFFPGQGNRGVVSKLTPLAATTLPTAERFTPQLDTPPSSEGEGESN